MSGTNVNKMPSALFAVCSGGKASDQNSPTRICGVKLAISRLVEPGERIEIESWWNFAECANLREISSPFEQNDEMVSVLAEMMRVDW